VLSFAMDPGTAVLVDVEVKETAGVGVTVSACVGLSVLAEALLLNSNTWSRPANKLPLLPN
jgi:hypothetical protein